MHWCADEMTAALGLIPFIGWAWCWVRVRFARVRARLRWLP